MSPKIGIRIGLIALPALILSGCSQGSTERIASKPTPRQLSKQQRAEPLPPASSYAMMERYRIDAGGKPQFDQDYHSRRAVIRPDPSDPRYDVSLDQIRGYQEDPSVVIVDARAPHQFANGHMKGAINLPASQKEANLAQVYRTISPEQLIIVYCSGSECGSSDMVYEYLTEAGYKNVKVFRPGWEQLARAQVDIVGGIAQGP